MIYKKNTSITGFCFSLETIAGEDFIDGTLNTALIKDGLFIGPLNNSPIYSEDAHCWMVNLDSTELDSDFTGITFSGNNLKTRVINLRADFVVDVLEENHGSGSWQQLAGSGQIVWTYTITESVSELPLDGVRVVITTDETGLNAIASGVTDQNGQVTFYLDAGTIYLWCKKDGYNFTNPDIEVVS